MALEDCVMLQVDAHDAAVLPLDLHGIRISVISTMLSKIQWFSSLPGRQRERLAAILKVCDYRTDEVIFREGDAGTAFFIIVEGRVRMLKAVGAAQKAVAEYKTGSERPWFGELAAFCKCA